MVFETKFQSIASTTNLALENTKQPLAINAANAGYSLTIIIGNTGHRSKFRSLSNFFRCKCLKLLGQLELEPCFANTGTGEAIHCSLQKFDPSKVAGIDICTELCSTMPWSGLALWLLGLAPTSSFARRFVVQPARPPRCLLFSSSSSEAVGEFDPAIENEKSVGWITTNLLQNPWGSKHVYTGKAEAESFHASTNCAAIIRNRSLLMVFHQWTGCIFHTLKGQGLVASGIAVPDDSKPLSASLSQFIRPMQVLPVEPGMFVLVGMYHTMKRISQGQFPVLLFFGALAVLQRLECVYLNITVSFEADARDSISPNSYQRKQVEPSKQQSAAADDILLYSAEARSYKGPIGVRSSMLSPSGQPTTIGCRRWHSSSSAPDYDDTVLGLVIPKVPRRFCCEFFLVVEPVTD
ncbi:hypothetical protein M747DRAFT_318251 [Aspergillus niger ATCC 13496]|uniref:Uncharacterized protein n=3 Tax=Aspergillus niger TaxID=5061 RepID=A2QU52_ASPNC|nr:hypothetical protein An09g04410 [Aspergillus niger]RDH15996.1 hypothetical protein M747DRAFT_318251 [Aspergillus niger ATCC 13496]CAK40295.1 hypothetical protein An09g04410 [Aspergillus niger]